MAATPVSAADTTRTLDITAAPRVMITFASGLVNRVLGDRPSARENAWQAVLADRERAAARAELADVLSGAVASGARNGGARDNGARNGGARNGSARNGGARKGSPGDSSVRPNRRVTR